MVKIACDWCRKEIEVYPSQLKRFKKHFCSRKCKYRWNTTLEGFWKGRKMSSEACRNMSKNHTDVSGSKNPKWNGGKRTDKDGYILVWRKEHPFADYHGYVREHRLVMEDYLKRYLLPEEIVHHKDGNKDNNKIENLEIYESASKHQKRHYPTAKQLRYSPAWKSEHSSTP